MSKMAELYALWEQGLLTDRELEELDCIKWEDHCDRVRKDKAEEE